MDESYVVCKGDDGKFLFEWDPRQNTIGIIRRDMFYRVQLLQRELKGQRYRIVEQRPKEKVPKNPNN